MGVDIACRAVSREHLVVEIEHRKAAMPFGQIDTYGNPLLEDLPEDQRRQVVQVLCPRNRGHWEWLWASGKPQVDIEVITLQLLVAHLKPDSNISHEAKRAAELFYQFVGPFLTTLYRRQAIHNEFGLEHNTIMNPESIHRHLRLFRAIDWNALRPVSKEHCRVNEGGEPYEWFENFEDFKSLIDQWGDVVLQAAESGRMLYIFST